MQSKKSRVWILRFWILLDLVRFCESFYAFVFCMFCKIYTKKQDNKNNDNP